MVCFKYLYTHKYLIKFFPFVQVHGKVRRKSWMKNRKSCSKQQENTSAGKTNLRQRRKSNMLKNQFNEKRLKLNFQIANWIKLFEFSLKSWGVCIKNKHINHWWTWLATVALILSNATNARNGTWYWSTQFYKLNFFCITQMWLRFLWRFLQLVEHWETILMIMTGSGYYLHGILWSSKGFCN